MRREEITNKKIKKLFLKREEEKEKLQKEMDKANEVGKKINEMKEEYDKLLKPVAKQKHRVQRIDEKLYPLVDAEKIIMDEFEEVGQPIIEGKTVYIEIINLIEEHKKFIRAKRNEQNNSTDKCNK